MAGLAGGAIGLGIGGPVGYFIGATIGTVVDQYFLLPRLFGEEVTRGGSLGNFDVNFAEEGAAATFCYGSKNRIGANIVLASLPWSSSSNSGGGKRGEVTSITWYVDAVYALCWNEIQAVERIDKDGAPSYIDDPDFFYQATTDFIHSEAVTGDNIAIVWYFDAGNGWWNLRAWEMAWENNKTGGFLGGPRNRPELAQFTPGADIRITLVDSTSPYLTNWTLPTSIGTMPTISVIESRVTSVSAVNGVENTRLAIDLMPFVEGMRVVNYAPVPAPSGYQFDRTKYWNVPGTPLGPQPQITNDMVPFQPYPATTSPAANWQFFQEGVKIFPGSADTVEIRKGLVGQAQLSAYSKRVGPNHAPPLAGIAAVGFESLNISMHGNRIPQATMFVNEAYDPSVGGSERSFSYMMSRLCIDHGDLVAAELNFSLVTPDSDVLGLQFAGTQEASRTMAPYLLAFDKYLAEHSGQLHFIARTSRTEVNVAHEHLGARPLGTQPTLPLRFTDQPQEAMPRRIHLRYHDVDRDMQWGDVFDTRDGQAVGSSTRQLSFPIPMTKKSARAITRRVLRDQQELRRRVSFELPMWAPDTDVSYVRITETDVLRLDAQASPSGTGYKGEDYVAVVDEVRVGGDMLLELDAWNLLERPQVTPIPDEGTEAVIPQTPEPRAQHGVAPFVLVALDIPPLLDEHAQTPGVYLGYSAPGGAESDPASLGVLLRDLGDGDNFHEIGPANKPSVIGRVMNEVGDASTSVMDNKNEVVVELMASDRVGELQTVTDTDIQNGANLAAISVASGGWEIVQFKTATDLTADFAGSVTGRRWKLTGLMRGRLGSDALVPSHRRGDMFVLLDRTRLHFWPFDASLIGVTQSFRAVPEHRAIGLDTSAQVVLAGNSSKSLPVANLRYTRIGSEVMVEWDRRSRGRFRPFGAAAAPLMEVTERYEVVINPSTLNRTYDIDDGSTSFTYTAAHQTDDGTTDAALEIEVYQIDAVRGRGQVATMRVEATPTVWLDEDGDPVEVEGGTVQIFLEG